MHSFAADDMVTIVLAERPQPEDIHLTIQDFVINGQSMVPMFTSPELFTQSLKGRDFPYPVVEIRFGALMQMLSRTETIIVNPGTDGQFMFNVADLEGHS